MSMFLPMLVFAPLLYSNPPERKLERDPLPKAILIEGYYTLLWDGKASGVVCITKREQTGDFLFQYLVKGSPIPTVGVGLREGNVVSVGWQSGSALGVTRFLISLDIASKPKLDGKWTNLANKGEETLEWLRGLE